MKASVGRGKGFLGVLLYVFDAEKEPARPISNEVPRLNPVYFEHIGDKNGYTRHVHVIGDALTYAGKSRYLSGNRLHFLSERTLVRAGGSAKEADSLLQIDALDDRLQADRVRREPEYPGQVGSAAPDAGRGLGTDAGAIHSRHAGSTDAADDRLDRSRKLPEVVGGNMGYGQLDPRQLSKEFGAIRALRRDIKKPVWHCSLALPAGERLSPEQWDAVARDFMQEMGFDPDRHQYIVVRHNDTDYDHVHIVSNRIAVDGKVWAGENDVFKAINATQALERRHGLVLTPGIDSEPPEKRKPSKKEIQMAVRTGDEPPRMRLQALVEQAAKGNPTVVEFAERLEAEGVSVRANLASTGTMNGFSFKLAGVSFTGTQLGAGYKWAALQKKGVSYEQARDREELGRFTKPDTDGPGRPDGGLASEHGPLAAVDSRADHGNDSADARADRGPAIEPGPVAAGGSRAPDGSDRAADGIAGPGGGDGGIVPAGDGVAGSDHGRGDGRDNAPPAADGRSEVDAIDRGNQPGSDERGAAGDALPERAGDSGPAIDAAGDAGRVGGSDEGQRDGDHGQDGPRSVGAPGADGGAGGEGREGGAGADREPAGVVADAGADAPMRGRGGDWRARFKQASATKRGAGERGLADGVAKQSHQRGTHLAESDIRSARQIDPTSYLEGCGFTCHATQGGRQISVRRGDDEIYRVTQVAQGHWVACDNHENGIGDNIALVSEIEGSTKFPATVQRLIGTLLPLQPGQVRSFPIKPRAQFVMPPQKSVHQAEGRAYLQGRGIDLQTIIEAEKSGFVRYTDKAVLFVGRDVAGKEMMATRRAVNKADPVQKREIEGSDKRFPGVLPGTGDQAYIVDGGVDALALHAMAKRRGQPTPTVYVTAGVGSKSWLNRESMQAQLRRHSVVRIAGENEKNDEVQRRADSHRDDTSRRIEAITGKEVKIVTPPPPAKDMADLHAAQVANARAAEAAKDQAAAQVQPVPVVPAPVVQAPDQEPDDDDSDRNK